MKFSGPCLIQSSIKSSDKIFRLDINCPEIAGQAKPGQFVQVKIPNCESNIWPRPFSIHYAGEKNVSLYIKMAGKLTNQLSHFSAGDKLILTGPLGVGFKMPESEQPLYLVAGGVGLPPLYFLIRKLLAAGYPPGLIHLYSGAKTASELFAKEELKALNVSNTFVTEDSTLGLRGLVTEPLTADLRKTPDALVYACGPMAMLKEVAGIAIKHRCQVSLEQLMPCGWGVCNGCAVKIKSDNSKTEDNRDYRLARVCKEGPVFNAEKILWE